MRLDPKHKFVVFAVVCIACLFPGSGSPRLSSSVLSSGKIDPALVEQFMQTRPDQLVPVILKLADTLTAPKLTRYLDSAYVRLDDKRRAGLRILHQRAETSQRDLLEQLKRLRELGQVANIRSEWLTNSASVEMTAEAADSISRRSDIRSLTLPQSLEQIRPENPTGTDVLTSTSGGVEGNLSFIGADSAWRMGYTGKGRIVCVFDMTGVDGYHPAIAANWKGLDGDSAAAWKEWGRNTTFPRPKRETITDSAHGTMMVGIVVGHDDVNGDTVGVAPDAQWIAATWRAWEWAADPDGDPNTTADMPDVINYSMASWFDGCLEIDWGAIDMVEALGIVVACAAGNKGYGPYTVLSPANRADDSLTNFAVGSVDYVSGNVWWSSSRGPSPCDSVSIKPNVCAPGSNIRCAVPGGGYEYHGGTSMATPHVTGAVAILRQYAPDATVRQIKEALLAGATPRGATHPNNDYGWGTINIPKSMEYLARTFRPDLRVAAFEYAPTNVDDTLTASVSIQNRGFLTDSVYLICRGHFPGLTVLTDSIYFGEIDYATEQFGDRQFKCTFDDTLVGGPTIPVNYTVHAASGYVDTLTAQIKAGAKGRVREAYTWNGRFSLRMENSGGFSLIQSLSDDSLWEFDNSVPVMWVGGSLLIASDSTRVSDHYYDNDFWVDARHTLLVNDPGETADVQTDCRFNDGLAENQIGVEIRQQSYSWRNSADNKYVILEYQISNPTSKHISDIYVGLALELSEMNYSAPWCPNHDSLIFFGGCFQSQRLNYLEIRPCGLDTIRYLGMAVLSRDGTWSTQTSHFVRRPSESEKYKALTGGVVGVGTGASQRQGLVQYTSNGPFTLEPGQSDTVAFVLSVGYSTYDLINTVDRARERWKQISPTQNLPRTFALCQNYPNPFNSGTTIEFDLPVGGRVELTIYNVLGQVVRTLVDDVLPPGEHKLVWEGTTGVGREVASGVYFYRLRTGQITEAKKMLLLK